MKTKLILLALLVTGICNSQQAINYKALIKDGSGNVVASQSITIQFQILQGASMANVYEETHTPTTDANGIAIVNIGEGTTTDVFTDINWGADEHHLNVQIDTGGGLTDLGTTQFMAVPYAHFALKVATNSLKINQLQDGKSDDDGSQDGSSVFLGLEAGLNDDGTGNANIGVGFRALYNNTNGYNNSAIGHSVMYQNTTGFHNTAIGYQALLNNTIGSNNTAVGLQALINNTSGINNAAHGFQALKSNTTGSYNTANGYGALFGNTTGNYNTANGYQSLIFTTTGGRNTANGYEALLGNIEGRYNTGIGFRAGYQSIGNGNIFIGYQSGYNELNNNKLYIENSDADPNNALIYGEFGLDNTSTGNILRTNSEFQIGNPITEGYAFPTTDGTSNQILKTDGSGSLSWTNNNTSSGATQINELTDGKSNGFSLFLGVDAGMTDNSSIASVGVGFEALASITTGDINTALGGQALFYNTIGNDNAAIGFGSLYNNISGSRNVAVGVSALFNNTSGNNNTAIGNNAQVPDGTLDNQVRIGDENITYAGIQVAWTFTSDKRWKEKIRELPYGLDVVKQLKPVDYVRKNNEKETREMGFIAQDVEKILADIGYKDQGFLTKDDKGFISLRYNDFIALLTKAIQEQQDIIEKQNIEIKSLTVDQKLTNDRLNKIEALINTSQQ